MSVSCSAVGVRVGAVVAKRPHVDRGLCRTAEKRRRRRARPPDLKPPVEGGGVVTPPPPTSKDLEDNPSHSPSPSPSPSPHSYSYRYRYEDPPVVVVVIHVHVLVHVHLHGSAICRPLLLPYSVPFQPVHLRRSRYPCATTRATPGCFAATLGPFRVARWMTIGPSAPEPVGSDLVLQLAPPLLPLLLLLLLPLEERDLEVVEVETTTTPPRPPHPRSYHDHDLGHRDVRRTTRPTIDPPQTGERRDLESSIGARGRPVPERPTRVTADARLGQYGVRRREWVVAAVDKAGIPSRVRAGSIPSPRYPTRGAAGLSQRCSPVPSSMEILGPPRTSRVRSLPLAVDRCC